MLQTKMKPRHSKRNSGGNPKTNNVFLVLVSFSLESEDPEHILKRYLVAISVTKSNSRVTDRSNSAATGLEVGNLCMGSMNDDICAQ